MTTDRRVQRTRELLQKALIELLAERRYEAISVGDITERANVGRTTFYLHYTSKDDLFMGCHEAIVGQFHFGPHRPLTREQLLAAGPPAAAAGAYHHLAEEHMLVSRLFRGKESQTLLRRLRDDRAQEIADNLRAAFGAEASAVPLDLLANYLAGAQIALIHWWLEQHQPYDPETLARTFHRLQRAALFEAFDPEPGP